MLILMRVPVYFVSLPLDPCSIRWRREMLAWPLMASNVLLRLAENLTMNRIEQVDMIPRQGKPCRVRSSPDIAETKEEKGGNERQTNGRLSTYFVQCSIAEFNRFPGNFLHCCRHTDLHNQFQIRLKVRSDISSQSIIPRPWFVADTYINLRAHLLSLFS